MKEENVKEPKAVRLDPVLEIKNKVQKVADGANATDRTRAREIMDTAKLGQREVAKYNLTPTICAILFLMANGNNRDFSPTRVEELVRRMVAFEWKQINATIGFYVDGEISDGQHRLASAAIAGFTLVDYPIVFGMERDAISAVDCGWSRDGASHVKLLYGIKDASTKQTIVKTVASYMAKLEQPPLHSPAEVAEAIHQNDALLDRCLEIGAESIKGRNYTVLNPKQAASLAFLMLKYGWADQTVREKLALFQTGEDRDSENSPFFVGATLITKSRQAREARNRLSGVKELAVVMLVMQQTEAGIKVINPNKIRTEIKATFPDPTYSGSASTPAPTPVEGAAAVN